MKVILATAVLTIGLLSPAFAQKCEIVKDVGCVGGISGAPAPLIGTGLPGLALGIGYGVYWLARRRRNVG
jgi:hypothetical protein